MRRIASSDQSEEAEELRHRFKSWMHENDQEVSMAGQFVRLCNDKNRKDGVVSAGKKHRKREESRTLQERIYLQTKASEVKYTNLQRVGLKWMTPPPKGWKQTGLKFTYNHRGDPDLGWYKIAIRRVPCCCSGCMKQMKMPWDPKLSAVCQPRYASSVNCQKWPMFQGSNDWRIAEIMVETEEDDEDVIELPGIIVLEKEQTMAMDIEIGNFGVLHLDDNTTKFEIV